MSITGQETPNEGMHYLFNRLISDLVGTLGTCDHNAVDVATNASFDCLGAVYSLIGSKGGDNELLGTSVSIGGGYLLTAKHTLANYKNPYISQGKKSLPKLGICIDDYCSSLQSKTVELVLVSDGVAEGLDLALLRVESFRNIQKLKSARLPAFESSGVASKLSSSINDFGLGALFVGFGATTKKRLVKNPKKNDITTFICNRALTNQTMTALFSSNNGKPPSKTRFMKDENEYLFQTVGSAQRFPYWNDSGGGLFVFHEGKVFLVGIHFKSIRLGTNESVTYPLYVNLLTVGPIIKKIIQIDRVAFLSSL